VRTFVYFYFICAIKKCSTCVVLRSIGNGISVPDVVHTVVNLLNNLGLEKDLGLGLRIGFGIARIPAVI